MNDTFKNTISYDETVPVLIVGGGLIGGFAHGHAADIEWEVENPFRYYKVGSSFALHEAAFDYSFALWQMGITK